MKNLCDKPRRRRLLQGAAVLTGVIAFAASPAAYAVEAPASTLSISRTADSSPSYEAPGKTLASDSDKKSVSYSVDLAPGAKLQLDGNSVAVLDAAGSTVGRFDAAWAADSSGKALAAKFTVAGNKLTQTVQTTSSTIYPVTIHPTYARTGNAEDAKINAVYKGMLIPSAAPAEAQRSSTNAAPGISTQAASGGYLPYVNIQARYVYDESGRTQPLAWHDYCTSANEWFYNADFRGPCANHDLCLMDSRGRSRKPCDDQLPVDMKVNCRYAYLNSGDMLDSCYRRASIYWAAVTANTKGWV